VGGLAALSVVGWTTWRRTRPLRRGADPPATAPPATDAGSSRTTFLAAWIGAWVAVGAAAARFAQAGVRAGSAAAVIVGLCGAFVLVDGLRSRVTCVAATGDRIRVGYAARPAWSPRWVDVIALTPPRWPLGGWRVRALAGSRTLMPSDLLGREHVLALAIAAAGLRFDGRAWIARAARQPS